MNAPLRRDDGDGLAVLTLDRAGSHNVLDAELAAALIQAVQALGTDVALGRVRAVLLRAEGRTFCAGGDITSFHAAGDRLPARIDAMLPRLNQMIHALATLPVPVVSAVQGGIGGGGIGLALCADVVLAAESMRLRGGYSAIGLSPDLGASWFLARAVGGPAAKRVLMLNEKLDARSCLALGAVAEVCPDDALDARARALARLLADGATRALGRTKALVDAALMGGLLGHLASEQAAMLASAADVEAQEGVNAFIGKRTPRFPR